MPLLPDITLRFPPLARGPLTVIYRGWDRAHRCPVIVKAQRATDDAVAVNRFGREAAVMLRLRHPSIVTLYDFHKGDPAKNDPAALVMEYVPGQTLTALIAAEGRLSAARAALLIEEIAAALDCVHGIGIVHRDVKPSNILLPRRGPAKLTDFGVARIDDDLPLTVMGDILGTIEYASPEQVHGNGAIDARSDVYSLAAVSYFALTGTPPFRAADSSTQAQLSVMHRQVFAEPPPLRLHRADLTPGIEAAVLRGLAKAPEARYESAGQLAASLRAAVTAAAGEPEQAATEASARRTGVLAGALASAVLLLAGFALWKAGEFSHAGQPVPVQVAQNPAAPLTPPVLLTPPVQIKPVEHPAQISPFKPLPVKPAAAPVVAVKPSAKAMPSIKTASGNLTTHPLPPVKPLIKAALIQPVKMAPVIARAASAKPIKIAANSVTSHAPAHLRPVTQAVSSQRRLLAAIPRPHVQKAVHSPQQLAARTPPKARLEPIPSPAAFPALSVTPALLPDQTQTASVGWYTVSGWIAVADQNATQKAQLVPAYPLWIKVDGQPVPALASGQWAQLPAGIHTVTYQPTEGLGVGPKTWTITLAPAAHLNQQVPLPSTPLPAIPLHLRNP